MDKENPLIKEITPKTFVAHIKNLLNMNVFGRKEKGFLMPLIYINYTYQGCKTLLSDQETKDLLASKRHFDLLIVDTATTPCALGFVHHYKAPFMFINTVGAYAHEMSNSGNPTPFSVTPSCLQPLSDDMSLVQRIENTAVHIIEKTGIWLTSRFLVDPFVREIFGPSFLSHDISKNVSFILQIGHPVVTYPRAFLPNVAEIACLHCKPAKRLPRDLENFITDGGEAGFIYFSMGTVVRAKDMPADLRQIFLKVFAQLPYRVLWKWESGNGSMSDLPQNVKLGAWMPQQDILGHPKLRAFITHGGISSFLETLYHAVPVVVVPVYGDQLCQGVKAEKNGMGITIFMQDLTAERLLSAINKVVLEPRYRESTKIYSVLLRDQIQTPLAKAIYWTEYVIRHKGAYHLQSPAKDMTLIQYYLVDVLAIYLVMLVLSVMVIHRGIKMLRTFGTETKHANKVKLH